jgi:hypothetical protein
MLRGLRNVVLKPVGVAAVFAAFSATAFAGAPQVKLNASGLAVMDAAIHFCTGFDPGETRQLLQLKKSAVGDQTDRQLDAMEQMPEYKQTLALMNTVLAGAPHDWATATCKNVVATAGGAAPPPPGHDNHGKSPDKGPVKAPDKDPKKVSSGDLDKDRPWLHPDHDKK